MALLRGSAPLSAIGRVVRAGVFGLVLVLTASQAGTAQNPVDSRAAKVAVENTRIQKVTTTPSSLGFKSCRLSPTLVDAGQVCVLRIEATTDDVQGVELRQTYCVMKESVPPGFRYDSKRKTGLLCDDGRDILLDNGPKDADSARGKMEVRIETRGWEPGIYHLELTLRKRGTVTKDTRHVAIKIRSPRDRLEVTVSDSWTLCPGTHAERMTGLSDGTLLHTDWLSTDNGRTWRKRDSGTIGSGAVQLRSGCVLGMAYRTFPIDGRPGWYRGERFESDDLGRTVRGPIETLFHVPQAKAAQGHAFHPGPLFMRSIVERPDGSLVALMGGWFKGDDAPCPQNPKRPYSRTYVCDSADGGRTWKYLSTIGYDHIGDEGYNEASVKTLPSGDLIAVLRTGSPIDVNWQDSPIMVSSSSDGGKTWAKPWHSGVRGVFPDVIVLSDGTLAVSYGRPGANIMFSTDGGRTWTDHTVVDTTPYSGYTTIREIAPAKVIMVFGTRDRLDPTTNSRKNEIRVAEIRYRGR